MLIMLHSGMSLGVMLAQCWPPSVVNWINPSSVPAQIVSFLSGDSARAKIVS
jgi:hypothetical protein